MQSAFDFGEYQPGQGSLIDEYPGVFPPSHKNELMSVPKEELYKLRWGLLKSSVSELLDERSGTEVRTHVLEWIFSDNREYSYSFINCVLAWGEKEGEDIQPTEFRAILMRLVMRRWNLKRRRMAEEPSFIYEVLPKSIINKAQSVALSEDACDRIADRLLSGAA